jgi:hypothetical protein
VLVLCFATMTAGCAKDPPPPRLVPPPVVDLAPVRCPDLDPAIRAEFTRRTPVPKSDVREPDGVPGLSRTAVRGWIDRLDVGEVRKNAAGQVVIQAYDNCRAPTPPVPAPQKPAA